jgi:hypothetical protein
MAKGQARDPATCRFVRKPAKVKGAKYTKAKLPVAVPIFLEVS